MSKLPFMKFYVGDHLKDPAVTALSLAAQGAWVNLNFAMHEADQSGSIEGTLGTLRRIARADSLDQMESILEEFNITGCADVTQRNGKVTITNRRMKREHDDRNSSTERVRRHREKKRAASAPARNADVTPPIHIQSSDSEEETPLPPFKKGGESAASDNWFSEKFWSRYPKKIGEESARRAMAKLDPDDGLKTEILAALENHKRSEQWQREGGRFIAKAENWIRDRRWREELKPATAAEATNGPARLPRTGMIAGAPAVPQQPKCAEVDRADLEQANESVREIWMQARDELAQSIAADAFDAFIRPLEIVRPDSGSGSSNRVVLAAPSPYVAERAAHYRDEIAAALEAVSGHPIDFDFGVIAYDEELELIA